MPEKREPSSQTGIDLLSPTNAILPPALSSGSGGA